MLVGGHGKVHGVRRDPAFAVLGLALVGVAVLLLVLVWPDGILPDCSYPPHMAPGEVLIDYYDCTDHPVRETIRAYAPVAPLALLAAIGLAAVAYGVRRHPS